MQVFFFVRIETWQMDVRTCVGQKCVERTDAHSIKIVTEGHTHGKLFSEVKYQPGPLYLCIYLISSANVLLFSCTAVFAAIPAQWPSLECSSRRSVGSGYSQQCCAMQHTLGIETFTLFSPSPPARVPDAFHLPYTSAAWLPRRGADMLLQPSTIHIIYCTILHSTGLHNK